MWNNLFLGSTKRMLKFYTKSFDSVALWLGVTVVALAVYILWSKKRSKLPPGPIGVPIFGYYPFLRNKPLETLEELAKKYGNIFGLYIGSKYIVFMNDWEAVKDGLGQNATLDKPQHLFEKIPFKFGFGGSNGEEWVETRRLAAKVMKDGLEKNQWEDEIEKELSFMIELLTKEDGKPVEVRSFFRNSFTNNVIALILGDRFEAGNPIKTMVSDTVDFIMENLRMLNMANFSKPLALILHMMGLEILPPFTENTKDFLHFVSDTVDAIGYDSKSEITSSFISRFKEEIDIRKKTKRITYASDDNLKGTIVALMVGGSETTRTAVIWVLIAMAEHPDKQRKVHEELDRVVGKEGSVRWSDRAKIPYTLAALLESLRWTTLGPIPPLRLLAQDIEILGYHIPKGTFLTTNIRILHNDTRFWKNPDQYIPERFLTEDGQKVNMAPDSFIPFSYGKRSCPGKLLALMDMLQYFSALMQRFKIVPKEGDKVNYKPVLGFSYQAKNAEIRFIPR